MTEPDVSELMSVQQAIAVLDSVQVRSPIIRLPLHEAQGLYLAEDLIADRDYPPFNKSLMDGYAVRSADLAATPADLTLIGEVAAGRQAQSPLAPGQTIAIMTGAPIPTGADGVVPIEDTTREGNTIRILRAAEPNRFIAHQGADTPRGRVVLPKGTRLEAAQLAVAATIGAAHLQVHPRPRVAVFSTGDELIGVTSMLTGSQIRNSNGPMLVALLQRLGCQVTDLGIVQDEPKKIRHLIDQGLQQDVLFISGGMSMGAYDHVPRLLTEMSCDLKITKLRIKPGKPFVFAVREDKFVFGLPGNPVSGFACTVRLASRLLTRLAGGTPTEKWLPARLTQSLGPNGPREFYQPARLDWTTQGPTATPLAWKGSADLFTLAAANALLVRPENQGPLAAGDMVQTLEI